MCGHHQLRLAAILLTSLTLGACSAPAYVDRGAGAPGLLARALGPVVYEVDAELERTPPGCIAVLPFETVAETREDMSGQADYVRRALYAHLAPRASRDVELARIDATLRRLSRAERRDHALVGRSLGCDTLLIGTVTEYRQRYLGLYSDVAVGAQIELIRAEDGARLFEARHVAVSRGGGLPISPLALVEGAVRAVTNISGEQLDRMTDDLARRLVSALPATARIRSGNFADVGSIGDAVEISSASAPSPLAIPDGGGLM